MRHCRSFLRAAATLVAAAGLAWAGLTAPADAQMPHDGHHGHGMATAPGSATAAYQAANATMHRDMAIEFTGDADVDFVRGMIPHHQGAIDMAEVLLQHGHDPELRRLAEEIIAAQQAEIALMKEWLARHGQ